MADKGEAVHCMGWLAVHGCNLVDGPRMIACLAWLTSELIPEERLVPISKH